ncbi:MAG: hypothetical protein KGN16_09790 [Burkholderiales bacterium]|nr:hypothetical protein [Burkholderiales bacterium]
MKVAEITDRIDAVGAEVQRAEDAKPATTGQPPADATGSATHRRRLRPDLLGTWADAQA